MARRSADVFIAELVESAVIVSFALDATAVGLRVASESRFARANGAVTSGHTFGIAAAKDASLARIPAFGAAVRVDDTILVRQAVVVGATANLLRADVVLAVLEVGAARVSVACLLANTLQAQLVADAVAAGGANRGANSCIANSSAGTLVVVAAVLNGNAAKQRISSRPGLARADSDVIFDSTVGASAARVGD